MEELEKSLNDLIKRVAPLFTNEPSSSFTSTTNNIVNLPSDSFATPTNPVILTHTPGVLRTAMRSDAAPKLSQEIAPTWTASHIWTPSTNTVPITINTPAILTSANMQTWSPLTNLDTVVTNDGDIGVGDETPTANVSMKQRAASAESLGPLAWFRAEDYDGSTTWPDHSGNGYHLTAHGSYSDGSTHSVRPRLNAPSGVPDAPGARAPRYMSAIDVNWSTGGGGSPDFGRSKAGWFQFDGLQLPSIGATAGRTIVYVVRDWGFATAGGSAFYLMSPATDVTKGSYLLVERYPVPIDEVRMFEDSVPYCAYSTPYTADNQNDYWACVTPVGGTGIYCTRSGVALASGGTNTTNLVFTKFMRPTAGWSPPAVYSICEVIIFNYALTAPQIANLNSYLANRLVPGSSTSSIQPLTDWKTVTGTVDSIVDTSLNFGLGTAATTPAAKLHVVKTTEQLRLGYDAITNYLQVTVGSAGGVTFDTHGATPQFTFADPVNITGLLAVTGAITATTTITATGALQGLSLRLGTVANYSNFNVGVQSGDITYTLPTATATGILSNNGSSVLSWATLASLGIVTGTGTTGKMPIFVDGATGVIGDGPFSYALSSPFTYVDCTEGIRVIKNTGYQQVLAYDPTHAFNTLVSSASKVTFSMDGGSPEFRFKHSTIIENDYSTTFAVKTTASGGINGISMLAKASGMDWALTADSFPATGLTISPTASWASGKIFNITDYLGNSHFFIDAASGSFNVGLEISTGSVLMEIGSNSVKTNNAFSMGCKFGPQWGTSLGSVILGYPAGSLTGAYFAPTDYKSTAGNAGCGILIAGAFENISVDTTVGRIHNNVVGIAVRPMGTLNGVAIAHNFGEVVGIHIRNMIINGATRTANNGYGIQIDKFCTGTGVVTPNVYGINIAEVTNGATISNGLFLNVASVTGQYKAIAIRDQNSWIGSDAAAELDFASTTFKWKVGANTEATLAANSLILRDGMIITNSANTTGLKIGAAGDKLGLWSVAPAVRPGAFTQTYATASHTHPAMPTYAVALTDSTTGTAATTLVDVGVLFNQSNINNNFASMARQTADIITAITDLKQVVNAIIDDLQSYGALA